MYNTSWSSTFQDVIFQSEITSSAPSSSSSTEFESETGSWVKERLAETDALRAASWPRMKANVINVLEHMKSLGINLPLFLDALSWGHEDCREDPIISLARTVLMTSSELPMVVERWWKPPRSSARTARPVGANKCIEELALTIM